MKASKVLMLVAVIAFVLAVFKVTAPVPLVPTGLAFMAASLLIG